MSVNGTSTSGLACLAMALKARFAEGPREPDAVWRYVAGHPAARDRLESLARRKAREYHWPSPDVVHDLVQDSLLRLRPRLRTVDLGRSAGEIGRFLDQQLAWCCADSARKLKNQQPGLPADDLEWVADLPPEDEADARRLDVLEALLHLPEPLRTAMNLRLGGRTLEQIGAALGTSISTVHRQIHQATQLLRGAMDR